MLEMRERILRIVPDASEVVSYGMPAFKLDGAIVAGLRCNKDGIGYYPFSGSVLKNFSRELSQYSQTKGALHIPLGKPLPLTVIRKLIKARISDCAVQRGEVDLDKYDEKDSYWRSLKLAAPARRGLIDNKIYKLSDLRQWTIEDFTTIHAIGPNAIAIIKKEMRKKKVSFKTRAK